MFLSFYHISRIVSGNSYTYQLDKAKLNTLTVQKTADDAFSFSVNTYETQKLRDCKHHFELGKSENTVVCLDLAMRGIGSYSCGPEIPLEHEIPEKAKRKFVITF